ncbi:hypothetical protein EDD16DRAFT_1613802 [Pisolithus croceorrhizus]|nr:hypothetical protein EDD16DRAFT_1613802 [Pisolithus croceorrhizus]
MGCFAYLFLLLSRVISQLGQQPRRPLSPARHAIESTRKTRTVLDIEQTEREYRTGLEETERLVKTTTTTRPRCQSRFQRRVQRWWSPRSKTKTRR